MAIDKQQQYNYFNSNDHQYDPQLILNPPIHTQNEIDELLEKLDTNISEGKIADFGAGSGRVTIPLIKKGYTVYSIDISEESLANLTKVCEKESLKPPILLSDFPKDITFKAILGADILHHVDFDEYFPQLYEALEPGGTLIFSEPNAYNLAWYMYLPLVADWDVEKGMMNCTIANFTKKLQAAGFKDIKLQGLGILPRSFFNWSRRLCKLHDALGNVPILKHFAYRYIVQATK